MTRAESGFSAEFRFLASMLRGATRDLGTSSPPAMAGDFDWSLLLALTMRHRVAPALAEGLRRAKIAVPEQIGSSLDQAARQAALDELALAASVREVCRASAQSGLRMAVLKGVPLSFMLHNRLGLRISRDIDLLIAPEEAHQALHMLAALGFRPLEDAALPDEQAMRQLMRRQKDIELIHPARQQLVELHWRLFDNLRLLPLPSLTLEPLSLPMGLDVLVLPPPLNLLYLANHGCQHGWSRLKWLADFAGLAARWDGDALAALHDTTSLADGRRALAQALLLCADLFEMPLAPALEATLRRDRRVRFLVIAARHCMTASGSAELETLRFGSTVKSLSHYLLNGSLSYLMAEAHLDLTDMSAEHPDAPAHRFGLVGRLSSWCVRHVLSRSHALRHH
jgi:hypothetical protein